MTKLSKAEELEAARNLEPDDCDIAAVGNGRYTREMSLRRSAELAAERAAKQATADSVTPSVSTEVSHGSR